MFEWYIIISSYLCISLSAKLTEYISLGQCTNLLSRFWISIQPGHCLVVRLHTWDILTVTWAMIILPRATVLGRRATQKP